MELTSPGASAEPDLQVLKSQTPQQPADTFAMLFYLKILFLFIK